MILDKRVEFCSATAANGSTVTQIIGNVADLGTVTRDLGAGPGEPLYLVIIVTTLYSGGTSAEFQLRSSTEAALTGGTTTTHYSTGAVAVASLIAATATAGAKTFIVAMPAGTVCQRYLGMWLVTVGAVAAGAISAFLTPTPAAWRAYADASN